MNNLISCLCNFTINNLKGLKYSLQCLNSRCGLDDMN